MLILQSCPFGEPKSSQTNGCKNGYKDKCRVSKQVQADPGADRRGRGFTGSSVSGYIFGEISRDRRNNSCGSRWHRAGGKRDSIIQ